MRKSGRCSHKQGPDFAFRPRARPKPRPFGTTPPARSRKYSGFGAFRHNLIGRRPCQSKSFPYICGQIPNSDIAHGHKSQNPNRPRLGLPQRRPRTAAPRPASPRRSIPFYGRHSRLHLLSRSSVRARRRPHGLSLHFGRTRQDTPPQSVRRHPRTPRFVRRCAANGTIRNRKHRFGHRRSLSFRSHRGLRRLRSGDY